MSERVRARHNLVTGLRLAGGRCRGRLTPDRIYHVFFHSNSVKLGPEISPSMSTCQLNTMPALRASDTQLYVNWNGVSVSSAVTGQSDIFKCYIRNGVASDSRGDGSQHYLHLSSLDGGPIGVFVQGRRWVTHTWWSLFTMTYFHIIFNFTTTTE